MDDKRQRVLVGVDLFKSSKTRNIFGNKVDLYFCLKSMSLKNKGIEMYTFEHEGWATNMSHHFTPTSNFHSQTIRTLSSSSLDTHKS